MSAPIFMVLAEMANMIFDRVIPDPAAAEKAKQEFAAQAADFALKQQELEQKTQLAQIEVNKTEAAHQDRFVSGWRPFIGWVCGIVLAAYYATYILSLFGPYWISFLRGENPAFPEADISVIRELLYGMLGFGFLRTVEKVTGTVTVGSPAAVPETLPWLKGKKP